MIRLFAIALALLFLVTQVQEGRTQAGQPRSEPQTGATEPDRLGLRTREREREEARDLIEGAFTAAEAARRDGECERWQLTLINLNVNLNFYYSGRGRFGRRGGTLFPQPVISEWLQRVQEHRGRPCPPPSEPETPRAAPETPRARFADGDPRDDVTVAADINQRLGALLAEAEGSRRRLDCSQFRSSIREAFQLIGSVVALRFPIEVRNRWRGRIGEVEARPCPPPPPPSLGNLRVALARACGPQFERARTALLAGIDRATLDTAGDPQRLATLRADHAYISGLPVPPCPPVPSALMTGSFNTNFGRMELMDGRGTYTEQNGRVTPTRVDGVRLEATWEQSASARRCADGRYRGRLTFSFSPSGFTGFWGYCDETPSNAWSGQRR